MYAQNNYPLLINEYILLILSHMSYDLTFSLFLPSWMRGPIKCLGRAIIFCCGFHHINIVGLQATAEVAPILCCAPHSSYFDMAIMFALDTLPSGVSRVENGRIFLFGSTYLYISINSHHPASFLPPWFANQILIRIGNGILC